MSAPNQGRQSPEPEQQSGKQLHEPVAGNPNKQGAESASDKTSSEALKNLESNPKHVLEDASKERDIASAESRSYQELVARLETQIAEHEKALKAHETSLAQLRDAHAEEIHAISASSKEEYDAQLNELMLEHAENIKLLEKNAHSLGCNQTVQHLAALLK